MGERHWTVIMKIQYVFILCLFSVVMAAVSEVSLCQVPVGLTPVFEADKRSKKNHTEEFGWFTFTHPHKLTHAQGCSHTHTQISMGRGRLTWNVEIKVEQDLSVILCIPHPRHIRGELWKDWVCERDAKNNLFLLGGKIKSPVQQQMKPCLCVCVRTALSYRERVWDTTKSQKWQISL